MLGLADFEDETVAEPLVGKLDLLAVAEFLAEEAVFITDRVAMSWIAKGGDGIKEAGGKTAQTAIA